LIRLDFAGSEITRSGTILLVAGTDEMAELITIRDQLLGRQNVVIGSSIMQGTPGVPPPIDEGEEG
jgi:hypothetical protein